MANLITDIGKAADENKAGFVCIKYRIAKLKVKSSGPPPVAKNADISDINFNDWGFSVIIRGHQKGELSDKAYNPFITRLPYEIVAINCYITVEDNFVLVWLKKKEESKSWENEIKKDRLETADTN